MPEQEFDRVWNGADGESLPGYRGGTPPRRKTCQQCVYAEAIEQAWECCLKPPTYRDAKWVRPAVRPTSPACAYFADVRKSHPNTELRSYRSAAHKAKMGDRK